MASGTSSRPLLWNLPSGDLLHRPLSITAVTTAVSAGASTSTRLSVGLSSTGTGLPAASSPWLATIFGDA